MGDQNLQTEVKETRANLEILRNKIDALVTILQKEGITTKEEVDTLTKEMIQDE